MGTRRPQQLSSNILTNVVATFWDTAECFLIGPVVRFLLWNGRAGRKSCPKMAGRGCAKQQEPSKPVLPEQRARNGSGAGAQTHVWRGVHCMVRRDRPSRPSPHSRTLCLAHAVILVHVKSLIQCQLWQHCTGHIWPGPGLFSRSQHKK